MAENSYTSLTPENAIAPAESSAAKPEKAEKGAETVEAVTDSRCCPCCGYCSSRRGLLLFAILFLFFDLLTLSSFCPPADPSRENSYIFDSKRVVKDAEALCTQNPSCTAFCRCGNKNIEDTVGNSRADSTSASRPNKRLLQARLDNTKRANAEASCDMGEDVKTVVRIGYFGFFSNLFDTAIIGFVLLAVVINNNRLLEISDIVLKFWGVLGSGSSVLLFVLVYTGSPSQYALKAYYMYNMNDDLSKKLGVQRGVHIEVCDPMISRKMDEARKIVSVSSGVVAVVMVGLYWHMGNVAKKVAQALEKKEEKGGS